MREPQTEVQAAQMQRPLVDAIDRISPSFDKAKLEQEIATQDTQTRHTEAQTSRLLFMLAIGSR
jgi:hypothetical protein